MPRPTITRPPAPLSTSSRFGRAHEPLAGGSGAEPPDAVGHERHGDEHQPEHRHLEGLRRTAGLDELRQDGGEEHDRLRVRRADDEPVGHAASGVERAITSVVSICDASRR